MYKHYPKGKKLPALEQNILKYRAFEMAIILFHIEELKSFVLNSIRATDKTRLPESTNKLYEKMWAILVADKIITKSDSDEIQQIIDYRNNIAHRIHELVYDLSREQMAEDYLSHHKTKYDYEALKKLKHYRDKVSLGIRRKYIMSVSFNTLLFEDAEKTYEEELKRLEKRIVRQMAIRKRENDKINVELSNIDKELLNSISPYHPLNFSRNGTLTKCGVECCYKLYTHKVSPIAVAYLMRISYRSAVNRYKAWGNLK